MEKERLVIKNFGPIKSVDLDLGKMTILIGDQATGKSTIAKVLAICRYFSYIVDFNKIDSEEFNANEQFSKGLSDWGLLNYFSEKSQIEYDCKLYKFELKGVLIERAKELKNALGVTDLKLQKKVNDLKALTKIIVKSNFKQLIIELKQLKKDDLYQIENSSPLIEIIQSNLWTPNENFYRLNVKKVMDNPLFVSTERVLQTISFDKSLLIADAIQDNLKKINHIVRRLNDEKQIEPLSITYKNSANLGYVKKETETEFYPLHFGASGYQATIPILLSIKHYIEIEKKSKTFIVEEPELNLFPKTQKKLVEFFVESINIYKHSFLIPTHSPYILSSLNNLLYAYKIGNLENGKYKNEVFEIIPEQYWLNPNETSVYYLENGEAKNLLDTEEALIDINDLDSVSDIINKEFDKLLSIEIRNNSEHEG